MVVKINVYGKVLTFICDYLDFERIRLHVRPFLHSDERIVIAFDSSNNRMGYIVQGGEVVSVFEVLS